MTQKAATQSPAPERRPGWRSTLSDPAVLSIGAYAIVAMGAAITAYLAVFTIWAGYDDEGTLLVTLQGFAHGVPLYRDIYTQYGPFYYELFGGLFALTGHAVTTDASRSIVVVVWVGTSLLFGIAAQRLTGRLLLGVTGMIAAFAPLYVLANEPMHPQGLCVLLLGAFVLAAVLGPSRRPLWAGAAAGTLLAALLMTKINLGIYAVAAVGLAAVLTLEPLRRRRWIALPVVAAAVALPLFVVVHDLDLGWVRELAAVQMLAMAAVIVAAWPLGSRSEDGNGRLGQWLLGAVGGFAAALVAIVVAIVLTGPSFSDVYDGIVTEALRVREVNMSQFQMSISVVDWALAGLAGAVLSLRLRTWGQDGAPSIWPGLLRVAAGLAIWFSLARITPLAINPSPGNQDSLALVLAWVAAIPPAGVVESRFKRFLRLMLPALAVAEALQVYPVAGSQVGIAALAFVPVGALCLADGLTSLRDWSAARGGQALQRYGVVATVALSALAAVFVTHAILRSAGNNLTIYREAKALPFPGAGQLHVSEEVFDDYTRLVDLLHRHRCTGLIGYPSLNSFYLWSGIEPPVPYPPGAWMEQLDSSRQQRAVNELRASPRPCAIRNDALAAAWLGGEPPPDRPLVNYVLNDFHTVAETGEFQFMLPR